MTGSAAVEDLDERAAMRLLLDKQEIAEVLARYCRGVDRLDKELVRSCYHPDAFDDHGGYRGGVDGFLEYAWGLNASWPRAMHVIDQSLIQVDGDRAASETYVRVVGVGSDEHGRARDELRVARYVDVLERRDGGPWLIAHRRLVWEWSRGWPSDPDLLDLSAPGHVVASRDRDDPVHRPLPSPATGEPVAVTTTQTPADDTAAEWRRLLAKDRIRDVLADYCRGIDRMDLELLRTCFHDDAVLELGSYTGGPEGFLEWADTMLSRLERTVHCLHQILVDVDGDRARSETYATALHTGRRLRDGGTQDEWCYVRYVDLFEHRDGVGWAIAHRRLVFEWTRRRPPDEVLVPLPQENYLLGSRDRDDPSYAL